jgi:hypothetical protein
MKSFLDTLKRMWFPVLMLVIFFAFGLVIMFS